MEFLLATIFILFQGILSGTETAITRANWLRLKLKAKEKGINEKKIKFLENKEENLIITLIGTNIFVIFAASFYSSFFIQNFGKNFILLSIILSTTLSFFIGELLPKILAGEYPEIWLLLFSSFYRLFYYFFRIISQPLYLLLKIIFLPIIKKRKTISLLRRDLLTYLREFKKSKFIAQKVLEVKNIKVKEIMIPIELTVTFPMDADITEISEIIRKYRYSRYPVYQKVKNNIVKIITLKDLLFFPQINYRSPLFVKENTPITEAFSEMRKKGEHLAIVIDKNEKALGIITLEDIVEEMVGEIRREG
ncbi:MAG: CNNM domain-containing protein [candidate division WOR-3 bacterium]|nr:CNNM domain-containing protein [candidate division WOR-3 bacterium]